MNIGTRNACRVVGCLAVSCLLLGGMLCDLGGADADAIEPLWHVTTPPQARHVAADEHGSVVTGFRGDVWTTNPIGESQWHADVAAEEEIVPDAPAIDGALVAVPVDGRRVVALDRATGAQRWQQPTEGVLAVGVGESPAGPTVAVVSQHGVALLSGTDGSTVWSAAQRMPKVLAAPPRAWIARGRVVAAWSDSVSHVQAFDATNGALVWSHEEQGWATEPIITDEAVFLAANRKKAPGGRDTISSVLRLDVQSGLAVWERKIRGIFFPTFAPAVHDSTVVMVDYRGRVTALDATSGEVRWRRTTGRKQLENEPWITGDVVAFTTYGTGLVALSREAGDPLSNEIPGPAEAWAIIKDSAATGDQLYLLAHRTNQADDSGELWMLPGGPEGPIPPGWPQ